MKQLRSKRPALKGISISGFGMDADIHKSRESGFSTHLVNPVSFAKLEAATRNIQEI
jgi:hypothetical protein